MLTTLVSDSARSAVFEPGNSVLALSQGLEGPLLDSDRTVTPQAGGTDLLVSKRLEPANAGITRRIYVHLPPGRQKEAAEAFAAAMELEDAG